MTILLRIIMMLGAGFIIFQNRYRVLNTVLGNSWIRKMVVSMSMQLPFLRNRFMKQAFKF